MKTWFAELLAARPWSLATLVILALCSVSFYPTPAVNIVILLALPLLIFCLKQWKLLHCRWLDFHAIVLWFLGLASSEFLPSSFTKLFDNRPHLGHFLDAFLPVTLITLCALGLSCMMLPLLHRLTGITIPLKHLLFSNLLLWLVLGKTLFIFFAVIAFIYGH